LLLAFAEFAAPLQAGKSRAPTPILRNRCAPNDVIPDVSPDRDSALLRPIARPTHVLPTEWARRLRVLARGLRRRLRAASRSERSPWLNEIADSAVIRSYAIAVGLPAALTEDVLQELILRARDADDFAEGLRRTPGARPFLH
jgi:hypothetical protein